MTNGTSSLSSLPRFDDDRDIIDTSSGMKKDMLLSHETLMTNGTSSLSSLPCFDYCDIIDTSPSSRGPNHEIGINGTEVLLNNRDCQVGDVEKQSSKFVDSTEKTEDVCDSTESKGDKESHNDVKRKWSTLGITVALAG